MGRADSCGFRRSEGRELVSIRSSDDCFFSTTQGIMTLGALIGAGSFAAGASSRHWLKVGKHLLKPGQKAGDSRNLAMLTVLALDDFVGACYAAVHDRPEFNPADEIEFAFHVPEPVLALPKDAEWHLLGEGLGDEVMWLSNRARNLENALDSLDLSKADHDGFFERRVEGYARLAASALDLIAYISDQFQLTLPEKPAYYRQAEGLSKVLHNVESVAQRRAEALKGSAGQETNVTPLFPKSS